MYLYNTPPMSINLYQSSVRLFKYEQEVGDNLSVCVLNILPKVSSLPNLLAINLVKVEIYIYILNSHLWEPLTLSKHLALVWY